jgi:hypothetical protein
MKQTLPVSKLGKVAYVRWVGFSQFVSAFRCPRIQDKKRGQSLVSLSFLSFLKL